MAPKRPRDEDGADSKPKKQRSGFNVGPDNLPDGTWRRKVIKIKHDLVHKAKVKKEYAKIKAREPPVDRPIPDSQEATTAPEVSQELHPDRQAMLDDPRSATPPPQFDGARQSRDRRKSQRPAYFGKELALADQKKAEAEAKRAEFERRSKERSQKIEEREKFRKAMAKARTGGKNGQRKLGRESHVLLEKVKRMVG